METRRMFLAADSGGSKTNWILIDENGEIIAKHKNHGMAAVKEGILPVRQIAEDAFRQISSFGHPEGICLSLGGPNVDEVKRNLEDIWKGVPIYVEREACGNSMLEAASYIGCKAAVMCGTGSVAVGDTKTGRKYADGWGPTYGDVASGGGIGSDALRIFLRSIDGVSDAGRLTELFTPLVQNLDVSEFAGRMELKARAINMSRRELAALAPKIYELAEQGDKVSAELYLQAARAVAAMAYTVSDSDEDFTVLLCGGFFANKPKLLENCVREFAKISKASLKYEPAFSPLVAAQLAVLQKNGVNITGEILSNIKNNL